MKWSFCYEGFCELAGFSLDKSSWNGSLSCEGFCNFFPSKIFYFRKKIESSIAFHSSSSNRYSTYSHSIRIFYSAFDILFSLISPNLTVSVTSP